MAPTWIPMCTAMQVYCEPYFAAVERWRLYADPEVLKNRIALIECANKLLSDYSQLHETFEFELQCEVEADLEAEVVPTAGRVYQHNGDTTAFQAAKKLVAEAIFNRVGVFFQQNLLKSIAGINESYLQASNMRTRNTITLAVEKLFRLPEIAGKAHFAYRQVNTDDNSYGQLKVYPTPQLSVVAMSFVDYLLEFRQQQVMAVKAVNFQPSYFDASLPTKSASSSKGKKKRAMSSPTVVNNNEDEPDWDEKHASVGIKVAAYFPVPTFGSSAKVVEKRLFSGTVVAFARPSKRGAGDQLYHIRFEDNDEEDYFQDELDAGIKLYQQEYGNGNPVEVVTQSFLEEEEEEDVLVESAKGTSSRPNKGNGRTVSINKNQAKKGKASSSTSKSSASSKSKASGKNAKSSFVHSRSGRVSRAAPLLSETPTPPRKGKIATGKNASELVQDAEFAARVGRSLKDEDGNDQLSFESPPAPVADDEWTFDHDKIGFRIAAYFPQGKRRVLYKGKVIKYCPPSGKDENDQLYRVQFEDGDEEDYDEDQLAAAELLYAQKCVMRDPLTDVNDRYEEEEEDVEAEAEEEEVDKEDEEEVEWTKDHESVGKQVAAYFPPTGKQKKLYHGEVIKYAPPSATGKADQLYHVIWSDGDECDLEEDGYQKALRLYETDRRKKSSSSSNHNGTTKHVLFGNTSAQKRARERQEDESFNAPSPEKKAAKYHRGGRYATVGLPNLMVIDGGEDDEIHSVSGNPTPPVNASGEEDEEKDVPPADLAVTSSADSAKEEAVANMDVEDEETNGNHDGTPANVKEAAKNMEVDQETNGDENEIVADAKEAVANMDVEDEETNRVNNGNQNEEADN